MVHQARCRGNSLFRKMSEFVSVVALMSKAKERPVDRRSPTWRLALLSAIALGTAQPLLAQSLPKDGTVVHGNIDVTVADQHMQVTQSSEYGIIDWNSFNVDNGVHGSIAQPMDGRRMPGVG